MPAEVSQALSVFCTSCPCVFSDASGRLSRSGLDISAIGQPQRIVLGGLIHLAIVTINPILNSLMAQHSPGIARSRLFPLSHCRIRTSFNARSRLVSCLSTSSQPMLLANVLS